MRELMLGIAFFALSSPALAGNRQTANEFLGDCKVAVRLADGETLHTMQDVESAVRCFSYLHGLRDALAMQYVGHGGQLLCPAPEVSASQLVRVFVKFAEGVPERLHEDHRDIALEALFTAFPCATTTKL